MAIFPKIQSPCPYKGALADIMDGDVCRLCKREVFDLTEMSDAGRVAFLADCTTDQVCVSYRVPIRRIAAATAAIATLAAPMSAAAYCPDTVELVVGGINDLTAVVFTEDPADQAIPELPVVEEAAAPEAPAPEVVTTPAAS